MMEDIREWVSLDSNSPTGLTWIKKASIGTSAGSPAFTGVNKGGYYNGKLKGRAYCAHRVVFFLANGFLPDQVDHIDGNRRNNSVENLRASNANENQHNRVARGVDFYEKSNSYRARIRINGKLISLGYFDSYDKAHSAYLAAKQNLHPTAPSRCYEQIGELE